MIYVTEEIRSLINEMLKILGEEISLMNARRRQLSVLSEAIIARSDGDMEKILGEMEHTGEAQASVDMQLQSVRAAFAGAIGLRCGDIRLSRLIEQLPPQYQLALETRRSQIVSLAASLRKQHLQTSMLLIESARINKLLLKCLFPQNDEVKTYGSGGARDWREDTGLLNMEF